MSDIVERLRVRGREYRGHQRYYDEAADEIEKLRTENEKLDLELEHLREWRRRVRESS